MKKTLLIVLAIVIIAIPVFVFGFSRKSESPASNGMLHDSSEAGSQRTGESQQGEQEEVEAPQNVTIVYGDEGFSEDQYIIASGGTVTVRNESAEALEFSSDNHPSHSKNTELNMEAIAPGDTGQFTPKMTGMWGFHNHLLASHTGVLTVR